MRPTYTSDASLYRRRWADGEHLTVNPTTMHTGAPLQPTTDGVVIRTGKHGQTILACLTTEHAWQLCQQLAQHLGQVHGNSAQTTNQEENHS